MNKMGLYGPFLLHNMNMIDTEWQNNIRDAIDVAMDHKNSLQELSSIEPFITNCSYN
jgi:hypothetical protein